MSVLLCFADGRREVDTVAELDQVLDDLAALDHPVLAELRGEAGVLNLGVGLRDAAVVLFRDADGCPWCARSPDGSSIDTEEELAFARNGVVYRFFAGAALHPSDMRETAREFVRMPDERPTVVDWVPKGIGASAVDGSKNGP